MSCDDDGTTRKESFTLQDVVYQDRRHPLELSMIIDGCFVPTLTCAIGLDVQDEGDQGSAIGLGTRCSVTYF